jgi:uncharacterized membrane protein YfhO
VTVNGEQTEILRAYGVMSLIPIRAGSHTIEWVYDPITYRVGAMISMMTGLGIGTASIIFYANRKRTSALDSKRR